MCIILPSLILHVCVLILYVCFFKTLKTIIIANRLQRTLPQLKPPARVPHQPGLPTSPDAVVAQRVPPLEHGQAASKLIAPPPRPLAQLLLLSPLPGVQDAHPRWLVKISSCPV